MKDYSRHVEGYHTEAAENPLIEQHIAAVRKAEQAEHSSDAELSLLVIDLGDSCVVKVEKGNEIYANLGTDWWFNVTAENPQVIKHSFTDIRAAIDKLAEGEKLVPRIEKCIDGNYSVYGIGSCSIIFENTYMALCQLVGVEIPVWTAKRGEWEAMTFEGDCKVSGMPMIWRYTLKEAK